MGILRFLLAASVFIAHTNPIFHISLVGGVMAVEGFYIISGFYMAMVLTEKYTSKKDFYWNRFLRIYPTYFIIALIAFCLKPDIWSSLDIQSKLLIIPPNLFIVGLDSLYFMAVQYGAALSIGNAHQFSLLPTAWTLAVEIWFYLLAPFIVHKSSKFIIGVIIAGLVLRLLFVYVGLSQDPWNYRYFPLELPFFLFGVMSYRYSSFFPKWTIVLFPVLILSMIFPSYLFIALLPFCIPAIFRYSKSWKVDKYMGDLTYPFYLSHTLFLAAPILSIGLSVICVMFDKFFRRYRV